MTYVHNSFWCFFEKVHILFFQLLNFSGTFHKIFKKRELNMFVSLSVLIFSYFLMNLLSFGFYFLLISDSVLGLTSHIFMTGLMGSIRGLIFICDILL